MTYHATEYDVLMKSVIIGDSGVGKSSLLYRYADNDWSPVYIATIGVDFKMDTFETQGKIVKLQMWDTAGQERFKTICAAYYRGAHCIMLVYDVTNYESFANIKKWMQEVAHYAHSNIPMMLVGNKVDMARERVVPKEEADAFAEKHNMQHYEASAKSSHNVHVAFRALADQALQHRNEGLFAKEANERKEAFIRLSSGAVVQQQTCLQRLRKMLRL